MAERVVLGMSGGVDSSVSAALLVQAGYDVVGVAMRLWAGESESGCCSLDDFVDARRVAHRLGIPFYVMDFRDEFERAVVEPFVAEYAAGRTPNPCVRCNQVVKFGAFWERARELGATAVATGHYARAVRGADGEWQLWRGADPQKDQSYFLFAMPREQLAHTLFPVGNMSKAQVRAFAAELRLPVALKPDSQEVCFAPGRLHSAFVAERLGDAAPGAGAIVDEDGTRIGSHRGIHTVTVGQRHGLGIRTTDARWVSGIDAATNTVYVGGADAVLSPGLKATNATWLTEPMRAGARVTVKIRSRHAAAGATVVHASSVEFTLRPDEPLRAVTPGQAAVLYDGDRVLGGGWIA